MKTVAIIITIVALAAPFAANATRLNASRQPIAVLACLAGGIQANGDVIQSNTTDTDTEPYVVHG